MENVYKKLDNLYRTIFVLLFISILTACTAIIIISSDNANVNTDKDVQIDVQIDSSNVINHNFNKHKNK